MSSSTKCFVAVVALAAMILVPLAVLATPKPAVDWTLVKVGDNVVVQKRGGGTVEGEVVELSATTIVIKAKFGKFPVAKDDVESLQVRKSNSDLYRERAAKCKSAGDWFSLAEWARGLGELDLADEAYRKTVQLEPDHAEARAALGQVQHEGEWMTLEEAMRKQGKERGRDGEWRTPEENEALERAAKEKSNEKLRAEKRRGQKELELEYLGRPWGEVAAIETKNYRVFCNSTEEVARNYARIMELLHEKYSYIFGKLPVYRQGKGNVYVHANHRQFMDMTGSNEGIGGFYKPWNGDVTAYHGSFGTTGSTYEVLAHEGTHQFEGFILKDFRACPMWIIEGLAVFFGDGSELGKNDIEVGVIPQDRLENLRRFIQEDMRAWRLDHFCLQGQPYPGAFYASAWGIIYWCLWGDKIKEAPKAHNGEGVRLFEEYLVHVTEATGPCDYVKELDLFKKLLLQHTKFSSVADWEESYKEWILKLPVKELGQKKGSRWVSEKLAMEVTKPGPYRWLKSLDRRGRYEVVAFDKGGKDLRRISTYCWPNDAKAELSPAAVKQLGSTLFTSVEHEYQDESADEGYVIRENHGYETVEFAGTGVAVKGQDSTIGGNDAASASSESTTRTKFRVVFYVAFDRIYANVLEADLDAYDAEAPTFDRYLKEFKHD
ncbi:MAG: DUF1570 domain-containing protein [Planctomycetota bacterium]